MRKKLFDFPETDVPSKRRREIRDELDKISYVRTAQSDGPSKERKKERKKERNEFGTTSLVWLRQQHSLFASHRMENSLKVVMSVCRFYLILFLSFPFLLFSPLKREERRRKAVEIKDRKILPCVEANRMDRKWRIKYLQTTRRQYF